MGKPEFNCSIGVHRVFFEVFWVVFGAVLTMFYAISDLRGIRKSTWYLVPFSADSDRHFLYALRLPYLRQYRIEDLFGTLKAIMGGGTGFRVWHPGVAPHGSACHVASLSSTTSSASAGACARPEECIYPPPPPHTHTRARTRALVAESPSMDPKRSMPALQFAAKDCSGGGRSRGVLETAKLPSPIDDAEDFVASMESHPTFVEVRRA